MDIILRFRNNHTGIGLLIDERAGHRKPTLGEADDYKSNRSDEVQAEREEVRRLEAVRRAEMEAKYSTDIARAAANRRARDDQKLPNLGTQDGIFHPESEPTPQMDEKRDLDKVAYYVPVPIRSQAPCYQPLSATYTDLESAREAGVWTYPETPHERARCEVFKALWKEGMYMGIGFKFGCDFLVYPGLSFLHGSRYIYETA